jgi:hypothetical protein
VIVTISEDKGKELIKNIHEGIIKKLQSARQLVDFDKEMAAGLYTYALEEFGKLLLIKEQILKKEITAILETKTKHKAYLPSVRHTTCFQKARPH